MSANLVKPEKIIDIFMILDTFSVPMMLSFNMSLHFIIFDQISSFKHLKVISANKMVCLFFEIQLEKTKPERTIFPKKSFLMCS